MHVFIHMHVGVRVHLRVRLHVCVHAHVCMLGCVRVWARVHVRHTWSGPPAARCGSVAASSPSAMRSIPFAFNEPEDVRFDDRPGSWQGVLLQRASRCRPVEAGKGDWGSYSRMFLD